MLGCRRFKPKNAPTKPSVVNLCDKNRVEVHVDSPTGQGGMSKILVQTTIPTIESDWHIGRFQLVADVLRSDGHEVVARDRVPRSDGSDEVLSSLAESDFDELWLIAVDRGNGLAPSDVRGILRFRERGGGVLAARDHQNLGASLLNLGSVGKVNHFYTYNRERDRRRLQRDDRDNPSVTFPNYHSGANGNYQRIVPLEPVHEILRSAKSPTGTIDYFPAHPHEGAISVPYGFDFARVIAMATSSATGRSFNVAIAIDGEPGNNGNAYGRAIAISSFHTFADMNWDATIAGPPFVTEPRGRDMLDDPSRLEIFKDYIRNIAHWLAPCHAEQGRTLSHL
jgi:hypothetical protein